MCRRNEAGEESGEALQALISQERSAASNFWKLQNGPTGFLLMVEAVVFAADKLVVGLMLEA